MLACGESWGGVDTRSLVFFVKSDFTFKEIFVYYLLNEFDYSFFFPLDVPAFAQMADLLT